MRFRNVLVIAGILITWSFVTYYFLLRNIKELHLNKYQHRQKQLQQLEKEVTQLLSKGDRLMEHFLAFLKLQYQQQSHNIKRSYVSPTISILAGSSSAILSLMQPPAVEEQSQLLGEALASPKSRISKKTKSYSQSTVQIYLNNGQAVIPILVLACNRVSVIKCLDNLMQYRPNAKLFPIIVSQDCGDEATKKVILSYGQQLTLIEHPDLREIVVPPKERKFKGYYKIARHYGWALNYTFALGYEFAVIVEDDLNISPDFYEYFLGAHILLKQDPTLWCVSAWNDNGKAKMIDSSHPELLYRTDFFPGLGWMLTKDLWQELSIKWPKSFWDDWIRHPEQRKSRACIRPEISRTRTFGKVGVSNGLFFDKYLRYIKLSEEFVPFTKMNLSYLLKENYDKTFLKKVYNLPIVTYDELRRNLINQSGPVRIQYNNREQYKRITKMLGLMDDFKSGVPRTAYHGIVSFFYEKRRVFLAPNVNWKGYDLSWS